MSDATGVAEVMLGLPGFRVLEAVEADAELVLTVETVEVPVTCPGCTGAGVVHDRAPVDYRDLPAFGRPVRLLWRKRRYRCPDHHCDLRTWTEVRGELAARCLLTRRAAAECCIQVGINARPVAQMARELGVSWHTVMDAVTEIGEPLVDDPTRVGDVAMLGIDETSWLRANRDHPTLFATSLVDLEARRIIDVILRQRLTRCRRVARRPTGIVASWDSGGGHRPCRGVSPGP
jgi:transposase